ncbi:PTS mannose transporter subunit IID [Sporosarcina sp. ANT_H38]|uniref:phage holin n=1 Tax=Sporosarcina sp. ANT_H38 TaxID=2597358 RepID=UPI0011F1C4AD|nr:phage holin [Sporosarcina sp. ANT_H38]KAA0941628.1 PTS mannose transporter subunit IID [Sporosarcina sp. ANT_H38]
MGDKLKQYIGFIGGALGGILLFLQALGVELVHFNDGSINAFVGMLLTFVPLILVGYGIWKNQYLVTKKAKSQERMLKQRGLKKYG